jgi:hypothetical protein
MAAKGAVEMLKEELPPILKAPLGVTLPEAVMLREEVQAAARPSNSTTATESREEVDFIGYTYLSNIGTTATG